MNKSLKALLITALAVSNLSAGESAQNKTTLVLRSQRNNVAAFTTFHELTKHKNEDHLDGYVEATSFYGQTTNGTKIGEVFGANGTREINIGTDIQNEHILHFTAGTSTLDGTIKFDPKQIVAGTRIDYLQRLDFLLKGLYATVNLPVHYIAQDLNMSIAGEVVGGNASENIRLKDILSGKSLVRGSDSDNQAPLECAKIDGRHHVLGISDLELSIGYFLWENKNSHLNFNAGVVFPTSKKPTGEYLWEARLGYHKWGAQLGTDVMVKLWEKGETQKMMLHLTGQYTHIFEGTEKRTLGITAETISLPFSPYYVIGESGKGTLKPAGNVLTTDVDVEMGGKVELVAALAYTKGKYTIDLGYNFFWKDDETVELKTWTDDLYGIADVAFAADGTVFDLTNASHNDLSLNRTNLDTTAAETPSQCTHTLFLATGYTFLAWKYPVMLGMGASYEIPTRKCTDGEMYKLWSKIGVAF